MARQHIETVYNALWMHTVCCVCVCVYVVCVCVYVVCVLCVCVSQMGVSFSKSYSSQRLHVVTPGQLLTLRFREVRRQKYH